MPTSFQEAARAYGNARVATASTVDIFLLLIERCLKDLDGAASARERGDLTAGRALTTHARDVLFGLIQGLDRERGGQLAERLASLYVFALARTGPASTSSDLRIARGVLEPIAQAYRQLRSGAAVG